LVEEMLQQLVDGRLRRLGAEALDQGDELRERQPRRRAQSVKEVLLARSGEHGDPLAPRSFGEHLQRRLAKAALGDSDGAAKCLVVVRIGNELQIAHYVADLATIVEAHGANEAIRDCLTTERFLERAALRVGAVKDREITELEIRGGAPLRELADDPLRFVALIEGSQRGDGLSPAPRWPQRLAHAAGIGADHRVGNVEDLRRRAIVLLEPNDGRLGEILLKIEDVPD